MALEDHLTSQQPLGPIDQAIIQNPLDAAELLEGVPPFLQALERRATIVIGRRGAGKSSVLHGYRSRARYGRAYGHLLSTDRNTLDIVMPFLRWTDFDVMLERVGREIKARLDGNPDPAFITVETTARIWIDLIWHNVLQYFYDYLQDGDTLPPQLFDEEGLGLLAPVINYFECRDIKHTSLLSKEAVSLFAHGRDGILRFLERKQCRCHIIFDNLDKYPVRSPMFENAIAGFLRAIHFINENHANVNTIVCLPEEVYEYMEIYSDNIEKDFANSYQLRWKPIELLRIVCHRYRLFISLHDPEFYATIRRYDLSSRDDVLKLLRKILPPYVQNRLGHQEDTLGFIVRHTQLIPRHFILLFNSILHRNHEITGGYRAVEPLAVIEGVENAERVVAQQIIHPYRFIYPELLKSCRAVLSHLPPICEISDLDRMGTRFKGRIEDDIQDVWKILFDIGIIGIIEPHNYSADGSGIYLKASFRFNTNENFGRSEHRKYCFHPLFSKFYSLVRGPGVVNKAIYPDKLQEEVLLGE